jgi:hypothetical protein
LRSFFKSAPRRRGWYFFFLRVFSASKGKKKKRIDTKCNFKKAYTNKHCNKFLSANSYFKPVVLFSFGEGGAKEKRTKKERRRKGISLVATSDKGYAPLTCAASPAGAYLWCGANIVR